MCFLSNMHQRPLYEGAIRIGLYILNTWLIPWIVYVDDLGVLFIALVPCSLREDPRGTHVGGGEGQRTKVSICGEGIFQLCHTQYNLSSSAYQCLCPINDGSISGLESPHDCTMSTFAKKAGKKPRISLVIPGVNQNGKEIDWYKESLRYRNTFLTLKEFFKPLPYYYTQKTPTTNQSPR